MARKQRKSKQMRRSSKQNKSQRRRTLKQKGGSSVFAGAPWTASDLTPQNSVNASGAGSSAPNHFHFSPNGVSPTFIMPQSSNALVEAGQIGGRRTKNKSKTKHRGWGRKTYKLRVRSQRGGDALNYAPYDFAVPFRQIGYGLSSLGSGMRGDAISPSNPEPTIQPIARSSQLLM